MTHEQILPASAGEALFRVFDRIGALPPAPLRLDCLVPAPPPLPEDYVPPSSNKILSESTKLGRNQKRTYAAMLKIILASLDCAAERCGTTLEQLLSDSLLDENYGLAVGLEELRKASAALEKTANAFSLSITDDVVAQPFVALSQTLTTLPELNSLRTALRLLSELHRILCSKWSVWFHAPFGTQSYCDAMLTGFGKISEDLFGNSNGQRNKANADSGAFLWDTILEPIPAEERTAFVQRLAIAFATIKEIRTNGQIRGILCRTSPFTAASKEELWRAEGRMNLLVTYAIEREDVSLSSLDLPLITEGPADTPYWDSVELNLANLTKEHYVSMDSDCSPIIRRSLAALGFAARCINRADPGIKRLGSGEKLSEPTQSNAVRHSLQMLAMIGAMLYETCLEEATRLKSPSPANGNSDDVTTATIVDDMANRITASISAEQTERIRLVMSVWEDEI